MRRRGWTIRPTAFRGGVVTGIDSSKIRPLDRAEVAKKYGLKPRPGSPALPVTPSEPVPATASPTPATATGKPKPVKPAKNTGKHAQTTEAVKAMITLVDQGRTVADAARELAGQFDRSADTFERAYYRHHKELRREIAAAQRMTADRAPKVSETQSAAKVSIGTRPATKVSADARPAASKVSVPGKNFNSGRTNKT
jgi:hypothetical protein